MSWLETASWEVECFIIKVPGVIDSVLPKWGGEGYDVIMKPECRGWGKAAGVMVV